MEKKPPQDRERLLPWLSRHKSFQMEKDKPILVENMKSAIAIAIIAVEVEADKTDLILQLSFSDLYWPDGLQMLGSDQLFVNKLFLNNEIY